jgi:hypothetical protein
MRCLFGRGLFALALAFFGASLSWGETLRTGAWQGFYVDSPALYPRSTNQKMELTFTNGDISGKGQQGEGENADDFSVEGHYSDLDSGFMFKEVYSDHLIVFHGKMSSRTLKGSWVNIKNGSTGKFEFEGPDNSYKRKALVEVQPAPSETGRPIPYQSPKMIEYNKKLPPTPPDASSAPN